MGSSKDYVPGTHSGFNDWQQTIQQFVTTNAVAWGIDAQTVTDLTDKSTAFGTLYDSVYNRNTRTLQQVAAFNQFRIGYTTFLRQLVQGSLVNNASVAYDDKVAMGLNVRTGSHSARSKIYTMPVVAISGVGGGVMEFSCADSADGRTKCPGNADGVILVVTITMGTTTNTDTGEVTTITEEVTIPSSKARFSYAFSTAQRGKPFSVVGKWYNNTDHSKDGPLGNAVSGFIG